MFKKAAGTMIATIAAADINVDYHDILHGIVSISEDHVDPMWDQFKSEFEHLSPNNLHQDQAVITFFSKVTEIIEHNAKADKTFTKGINQYTAMTFAEFSEHFNLAKNQENADQTCSATRSSPLTSSSANDDPPDSWNWKSHGGVSPVKNQESCGSCWAFSAVGCLESANLLTGPGILETYSEQQLIDCASEFDNFGCDGGLPSHAFEYIFSAGGIATEDDYPY